MYKKRTLYSNETTIILNEWFNENILFPYPTKEIKEQLADKTNLTVQQVTFWMSNKRKQMKYEKKTKKK